MLALIVGHRDPNIDDVVEALRWEGFVAVIAASEGQAIRLLEASRPALVVLIGASALADPVLTRLDAHAVPAVIAAASSTRHTIARLRTPAVLLPDDASPEEIAAAGIALIPRPRNIDEPATLECGPLVLDLEHQMVLLRGVPLEVPPKEFQILKELALEAGRPISSEDLLRRVWPKHAVLTAEDVHRHVYRLRSIIGDHNRTEPLIVTRRGFGYAIRSPVRIRARHLSSHHYG